MSKLNGHWTFSQQHGEYWDGLDNFLAFGYAGHGKGKNNPAMEMVKGVGPLPHGTWKPVEFFENHPHVGKNAVRLEPADEETRQRVIGYGRDPESFFMHGDAIDHPGEASDGCMIAAPDIRLRFWSEKPLIDVVAVAD